MFGQEMMKYHGPKDRLRAAQAGDTPVEELARLSQSEYVFVREAVVANPNTPQDVLASLVPASLELADDFRIALGLARNPKLSPEACAAIGDRIIQSIDRIGPRDFYPTGLVDAFVRNTTAPTESVVALANPDIIPKHIRRRITSAGVRPELLTKLLEDPVEKIRSRARRAMEAEEESS